MLNTLNTSNAMNLRYITARCKAAIQYLHYNPANNVKRQLTTVNPAKYTIGYYVYSYSKSIF